MSQPTLSQQIRQLEDTLPARAGRGSEAGHAVNAGMNTSRAGGL